VKIGGGGATPEYSNRQNTPEFSRSESPAAPVLVRQDVDQPPQDSEGFLHHHRHKEKKKKRKKDKKKSEKGDRGEREHRHHHKKKRKREHADLEPQKSNSTVYYSATVSTHPPESSPSEGSLPDEGPPPKRTCPDPEQRVQGLTLSPRRDVPTRTCAANKPNNSLSKILEYLLVMLEKKDVNNFFASPVSDTFAPGYSKIIPEPMDFSSMREKIEDAKYLNLESFRYDFDLICTNCMTYNLPDTVYYRTAKKLQQQGQRILAPERLRALCEHLPLLLELSREELGFDIGEDVSPTESTLEDEKDVSKFIEEIRSSVKSRAAGKFEALPDQMSAEEVLVQAKGAAKAAADKLVKRKVGGHMGYLQQKPDGGTSLALITPVPSNGSVRAEKPLSLEGLVGKVKNGTNSLSGFKEDRRNVAKAVHPLYYGAFSSHGPTHDSTFANLTKAETELIYSTYGDEVGVSYAESIKNFSRNCEYATFIVDNMLDILTGEQHRKTNKYLEEQKVLRDEESAVNDAFIDEPRSTIDFESLRSLENDGIDMSFLGDLQCKYNTSTAGKLDATAGLIENLRYSQTERLSGSSDLNKLEGPSEHERELANQVQGNLVDMVGSMRGGPQEFVNANSINAVRRAIGEPV